MKADISADTFSPTRRFSSVVVGQGQALVDTALNEQAAIVRHRMDVTTADEVGASGVPKAGGGFAVSVAPDGLDLLISPGRMYVDGTLCVNEPEVVVAAVVSATTVTTATAAPDGVPFAAGTWLDLTANGATTRLQLQSADKGVLQFTVPVPGMPAAGTAVELRRVTSLRSQPDRFAFDPFDVNDAAHVASGAHRVELDVWHRHISTVEDPSIREPALGDAGSATRMKVVWQIRVSPAGAIGTGTCALPPSAARGRLRASTVPGLPSDEACVLPDEGGYRGLENQLYRVEVHSVSAQEVVLKWQCDNASMASRVTALGTTLRVDDMGRDREHGFAGAKLVEVTDDALDLEQRPGDLLVASQPDVPNRTIKLAAPPTAAQPGRRPQARRWDGQIVVDLTSATAGQPVLLERGLEVALVPGALRPGDFWLIPARTANSAGAGVIAWPTDDSGAPLAQPPHGIDHHIASLAVVDADGTRFIGAANVLDCRLPFPALTAIEASDVGFDDAVSNLEADTVQEAIDAVAGRSISICSVLVSPGEDLAVAVGRLGAAQDGLVCLRVGTYTLAAPLRIEGRRHIQFAGAGPGTRIVAPTSEAALVFSKCTTVKVSNLHVSSGVVGRKDALEGLNGTLSFFDCASVTVDGVGVECAGGPVRAATCITVRNTPPATATRARIHGCELTVGHLQTGVLMVDVERVGVSDNVLLPAARPADAALIADADYRGLLRRQLVHSFAPNANEVTNASVTSGGHVVHFTTSPSLLSGVREANEWQRALDGLALGRISGPPSLERRLLRFASRMLASGGLAAGGSPRFAAAVARVLAQDEAVIGQGVVVAGRVAAEVSVTGNAIRGAIQGVHVGVHDQKDAAVGAGSVAVQSNAVHVLLPATARQERHGIFVGDADSILLAHNQVRLTRAAVNRGLAIDGVRIFGRVGLSVVVRHNHLHDGFTTGVTFAPLNDPLPDRPMWIITENVMEQAPVKVGVPARSPELAGADRPEVFKRLRGVAENFA